MLGLFISNLNCLGHDIINGSSSLTSAAKTIIDVLQDNSVDNVENLKLTFYDNPQVNPKAALDFSKFLVADDYPGSAVRFPLGISKTGLSDGVKAEFSCDPDLTKYLVCPVVKAEYYNNGELYDVPLVIAVDEFDRESGLLKGHLVTGFYDDESGSYIMRYGIEAKQYKFDRFANKYGFIDNLFYALSDIPDLSAMTPESRFNAFILQSDCPAIREDAKAGDVFIFGNSLYGEAEVDDLDRIPVLDSWVKLYSLKEKYDFLMADKEKKFKVEIDGKDYELAPDVFLTDQLLSSHVGFDRGSYKIESIAFMRGDRPQNILQINPEDAKNLYSLETLLVEDVAGFDSEGNENSDFPLHVIVVAFDTQTGSPIIKALNGYRNDSDNDQNITYLPEIQAGTTITVLDDRPKVSPTIALIMNPLTIKVNDNERECKVGELVALVDDMIVPIEFDSICRQ
ncbi:MAG: hypothetical protein NC095_07785 [Muribaculum sp.]|nr:hypothetical protein [Muribaculum sp.]